MKTLLVSLLCLSLSTPAFAGPIQNSIAKHANQAAQAQQFQRSGMHSKPMFWAGLAMMAGGATLAVLSTTALKKETCVDVSIGWDYISACATETNKALLWTGIGASGGGATLMALGGRRASLSTSNGLTWQLRF